MVITRAQGHFPVSSVEMPFTTSRTCPTTSRKIQGHRLQLLYWRKYELSQYLMVINRPDIYPCVLCAADFRSRRDLDKHNREEHVGERAFPYSVCFYLTGRCEWYEVYTFFFVY